jgi:small subunit ribosomal protein S13
MLYLLGVNLPEKKCVTIALRTFYGIGNKTSKRICDRLNINYLHRVEKLTDSQMGALIKEIKNYTIDMDLRKQIRSDIDNLINIKSYRGLRHGHGLPVRGQRTRSNGKTQKLLSHKFIKSSDKKLPIKRKENKNTIKNKEKNKSKKK